MLKLLLWILWFSSWPRDHIESADDAFVYRDEPGKSADKHTDPVGDRI